MKPKLAYNKSKELLNVLALLVKLHVLRLADQIPNYAACLGDMKLVVAARSKKNKKC